jgi:hypothetical protein
VVNIVTKPEVVPPATRPDIVTLAHHFGINAILVIERHFSVGDLDDIVFCVLTLKNFQKEIPCHVFAGMIRDVQFELHIPFGDVESVFVINFDCKHCTHFTISAGCTLTRSCAVTSSTSGATFADSDSA